MKIIISLGGVLFAWFFAVALIFDKIKIITLIKYGTDFLLLINILIILVICGLVVKKYSIKWKQCAEQKKNKAVVIYLGICFLIALICLESGIRNYMENRYQNVSNTEFFTIKEMVPVATLSEFDKNIGFIKTDQFNQVKQGRDYFAPSVISYSEMGITQNENIICYNIDYYEAASGSIASQIATELYDKDLNNSDAYGLLDLKDKVKNVNICLLYSLRNNHTVFVLQKNVYVVRIEFYQSALSNDEEYISQRDWIRIFYNSFIEKIKE